jgi:hypothetical protein
MSRWRYSRWPTWSDIDLPNYMDLGGDAVMRNSVLASPLPELVWRDLEKLDLQALRSRGYGR